MARRTKRRWWWFTPAAASGVTLWILNTWPPSDPIWRYLAYCLLIPAAWIVAASYFVAGTQWWRHLAKAVRIATALTCCVLVVLLLALVYRFRPRPPADLLKARAFAYKKHHIPGSQDSGITWYDAKATDLRVTVSNDTDNGYQDFDLIIDPDAWIVGVAELQNIPDCRVGPATRGQASIEITDNKSGKSYTVGIAVPATLGDGIRVLCDKFPAHTAIELVFAATDNPNFPGYYVIAEAKPNRGAKNPPTEVLVKGGYKLLNQQIKTDKKLPVTMVP